MADNKTLTVLQRVDNHDRALGTLQQNMDEMFGSFRGSLHSAMELIEAVVGCIEGGPAKIEAVIKENRQKRLVEKAEQEKTQVEHLVKTNVLSATDKITPTSLIVGRIFDKDGNVTGAGRNQVEYASLNLDVRENFLGQEVGFVFTTEAGEKFEVLEVYAITLPSPDAATPAPLAATAEVAVVPAAAPESSPTATSSN